MNRASADFAAAQGVTLVKTATAQWLIASSEAFDLAMEENGSTSLKSVPGVDPQRIQRGIRGRIADGAQSKELGSTIGSSARGGYDPYARDQDNDGTSQEGTPYAHPAIDKPLRLTRRQRRLVREGRMTRDGSRMLSRRERRLIREGRLSTDGSTPLSRRERRLIRNGKLSRDFPNGPTRRERRLIREGRLSTDGKTPLTRRERRMIREGRLSPDYPNGPTRRERREIRAAQRSSGARVWVDRALAEASDRRERMREILNERSAINAKRKQDQAKMRQNSPALRARLEKQKRKIDQLIEKIRYDEELMKKPPLFEESENPKYIKLQELHERNARLRKGDIERLFKMKGEINAQLMEMNRNNRSDEDRFENLREVQTSNPWNPPSPAAIRSNEINPKKPSTVPGSRKPKPGPFDPIGEEKTIEELLPDLIGKPHRNWESAKNAAQEHANKTGENVIVVTPRPGRYRGGSILYYVIPENADYNRGTFYRPTEYIFKRQDPKAEASTVASAAEDIAAEKARQRARDTLPTAIGGHYLKRENAEKRAQKHANETGEDVVVLKSTEGKYRIVPKGTDFNDKRYEQVSAFSKAEEAKTPAKEVESDAEQLALDIPEAPEPPKPEEKPKPSTKPAETPNKPQPLLRSWLESSDIRKDSYPERSERDSQGNHFLQRKSGSVIKQRVAGTNSLDTLDALQKDLDHSLSREQQELLKVEKQIRHYQKNGFKDNAEKQDYEELLQVMKILDGNIDGLGKAEEALNNKRQQIVERRKADEQNVSEIKGQIGSATGDDLETLENRVRAALKRDGGGKDSPYFELLNDIKERRQAEAAKRDNPKPSPEEPPKPKVAPEKPKTPSAEAAKPSDDSNATLRPSKDIESEIAELTREFNANYKKNWDNARKRRDAAKIKLKEAQAAGDQAAIDKAEEKLKKEQKATDATYAAKKRVAAQIKQLKDDLEKAQEQELKEIDEVAEEALAQNLEKAKEFTKEAAVAEAQKIQRTFQGFNPDNFEPLSFPAVKRNIEKEINILKQKQAAAKDFAGTEDYVELLDQIIQKLKGFSSELARISRNKG